MLNVGENVQRFSYEVWVNPGNLMYSMVTRADYTVFFTRNLIWENVSNVYTQKLSEVMDTFISLIMVIISQFI